jgi:aquaporin Z
LSLVSFPKKLGVHEALGTFFITFAALMTGNPAIIGLAVMTVIYLGAHISGAHYNPALTLAQWWRKAMHRNVSTPLYFVAQIVGALLAATLICAITGHVSTLPGTDSEHFWKSALIEAMGAFLICMILFFVTSERMRNNQIYGFAVGLTVTMAVAIGIGLSGAVYNPAIAAGIMVLGAIKQDLPTLYTMVIYMVSPLIGGIAAVYVDGYINE